MADEGTYTINTVHSIRATAEEGAYFFDLTYTDQYGETTRSTQHMYRSSDPYSQLTPVLTQWLLDNPGFPISPYVPPQPPTPEEIRAAMPALARLAFRNKFKAAGMTTAVITAYIADIEDESIQEDRQIFWEDAQSFLRLDLFVVELAVYAGKTPEQIDTIWTT